MPNADKNIYTNLQPANMAQMDSVCKQLQRNYPNENYYLNTYICKCKLVNPAAHFIFTLPQTNFCVFFLIIYCDVFIFPYAPEINMVEDDKIIRIVLDGHWTVGIQFDFSNECSRSRNSSHNFLSKTFIILLDVKYDT